MSRALLCVVLDAKALGDAPAARARAIFDAGADWIQLRDRAVPTLRLFEVARALVEARDGASAGGADPCRRRVIVNRRGDVARAAGADGVHLGFDALSPGGTRRVLGAGRAEASQVGRSLHAPEEVALAAHEDGLDYVHLAPIWDPISKPASRPPLGPAGLEAACRHGVPVFAQGGIDAERAARAIGAGAVGVALTGAVAGAKDPAEALAPIRAALDLVAAKV